MSSFLSQLLSIGEAVEASAEKKVPTKADSAPPKKSQRFNGSQAKAVDAQARYKANFSVPTTIAAASARMGIGHVACLNQVYRYERKGWMVRLPNPDPYNGGRGLFFLWTRKSRIAYKAKSSSNQKFTYRVSTTRK